MAIYVDSPLAEAERRRHLYGGDLFVHSPTESSAALAALARELSEAAFAPHDPQVAQDHMPAEEYAAILAELKPKFIHHQRAKELIRGLLAEVGADVEKTYFDVPRLRTMAHGEYMRAGLALPVPSAPRHLVLGALPAAQLVAAGVRRPAGELDGLPSGLLRARRSRTAPPATTTTSGTAPAASRRRSRSRRTRASSRRRRSRWSSSRTSASSRRSAAPIVFSAAQLHSTVPNTTDKHTLQHRLPDGERRRPRQRGVPRRTSTRPARGRRFATSCARATSSRSRTTSIAARTSRKRRTRRARPECAVGRARARARPALVHGTVRRRHSGGVVAPRALAAARRLTVGLLLSGRRTRARLRASARGRSTELGRHRRCTRSSSPEPMSDVRALYSGRSSAKTYGRLDVLCRTRSHTRSPRERGRSPRRIVLAYGRASSVLAGQRNVRGPQDLLTQQLEQRVEHALRTTLGASWMLRERRRRSALACDRGVGSVRREPLTRTCRVDQLEDATLRRGSRSASRGTSPRTCGPGRTGRWIDSVRLDREGARRALRSARPDLMRSPEDCSPRLVAYRRSLERCQHVPADGPVEPITRIRPMAEVTVRAPVRRPAEVVHEGARRAGA